MPYDEPDPHRSDDDAGRRRPLAGDRVARARREMAAAFAEELAAGDTSRTASSHYVPQSVLRRPHHQAVYVWSRWDEARRDRDEIVGGRRRDASRRVPTHRLPAAEAIKRMSRFRCRKPRCG